MRSEHLVERNLEILAEAYEVEPAAARADVGLVAGWTGPADDLLVALERRRDWEAGYALAYLVAIRRSVLGTAYWAAAD